jgi:GNAT superfamily N-acetyltransferase
MEPIEIKTFKDAFKTDVPNLILQIQNDEFSIPIDLDMQPDLKNIAGFYQRSNGNFWVATCDHQVVGTIGLLDIGNRQGALRKMFVHKNFRGKERGVGQKLLNTLFNWCRQKQFSEIFLGTTEQFVAAQRFYEKNGFREILKASLPKTFPVMTVDVKFYRFYPGK